MLQIQNALGILSSQVPTGNLLWVDQVNGVDALASRGRLTIPFRTLIAARDAAEEGDTIMVLPGDYNDNNTYLLRHLVNWYFFPGASVETESDPIFDIADGNEHVSFASIITGYGKFSADEEVLVAPSGSYITLEGITLYSASADCIQAGGAATVVRAELINSDGGVALSVSGGDVDVRVRKIEASAGHCIEISGGTARVDVYEIEATSPWAGIRIAGGSCIISATLVSGGDYGYVYDSSGGSSIVRGARILSPVMFRYNPPTNGVRFDFCVLLDEVGVESGATPTVHFAGTCSHNDPDAGFNAVGDLEISVDIV